ncbi:DUF4910 domain-containing protein [Thermococcus sp. Bubb.Bath]|nr:DUF4910 domain-containing protein [Thermococcus sp. Bubb.Bath]NJF24111.1 DUF4910 domain-containing protein [Thermococcus sp. Bubb.Bath]
MKNYTEKARINTDRVLHDIGEIAQFHRIQGSKELVEAVRYIEEELSAWGIESKRLDRTYDGKSFYLTLRSPIAWNLLHAELEIGGRRVTSAETPLIVMAHSPSGEGEGTVLPIIREEDWKRAEGKVVLVGKDWREAYKRANEEGAVAFIAYRRGTGEAFPYIGLFLGKKDLEWAGIPALTVSEVWANKVIEKSLSGLEVRARFAVQVETPPQERLPILQARIGDPPFVAFTAHICHPKPGANDNASGSAMLMELARVLSRLWDNSFRFGFSFLWVPEYYGTQAFFAGDIDPQDYYAGFNLDMIGGSQDRSGSTLMVVRTPLSRFSVVSGVLERALELANVSGSRSLTGEPLPGMKLRTFPYEMGSDHDVLNFFGIPSVMPITWPDRFYHSSADTVEKLSLKAIRIIGDAVLSSALFLAEVPSKELERFSRGYAMRYLGELSMERETEVAEKLVMMGLARDSEFLGTKLGHRFDAEPWLEWTLRGRMGEDIMELKAKEHLDEFKELTKDRRRVVHLHELIMLGELLPEGEAYTALKEEYGEVEREKLEKLMELAEKSGLVRWRG